MRLFFQLSKHITEIIPVNFQVIFYGFLLDIGIRLFIGL